MKLIGISAPPESFTDLDPMMVMARALILTGIDTDIGLSYDDGLILAKLDDENVLIQEGDAEAPAIEEIARYCMAAGYTVNVTPTVARNVFRIDPDAHLWN